MSSYQWPTQIKEIVLDSWQDGKEVSEIAGEARILVTQVRAIVAHQRGLGDRRAVSRYVKGRKDGRNHDSRGIYRSRSESVRLKHAVLEKWAAGELPAIDRAIAGNIGLTRRYCCRSWPRSR